MLHKMKRKLLAVSFITVFFTFFSISASAAGPVVAIIDSGTDMQHEAIAPSAWWNPVDIPNSGRDEDGNGYPDDIHGWNFAEGNNEVIDYRYLGILDDDIRRFFDVQTDMMLGQATQEDIMWLRSMIENEEFLKKMQIYGNFMHGTHVGGIAIEGTEKSELMAIKLIPTEVSLPLFVDQVLALVNQNDKGPSLEDVIEGESFRVGLVKQALAFLAKEQSKLLIEIGDYVDGHNVDVANGSFGTGYAQAAMIVSAIFENIFRRPATDEELFEVASHFLNVLIENVSEMADIAPDTLYVFAAGNDGTDNDIYPVSPTNIERDNVISVAATYDRVVLAPFSNFGVRTVDVAAPGLGIYNAVPGNEYLTVSGTSQAAPYVARVAAQIKEVNSALGPLQIRQIIEGTVDVKDFLVGKVSTSGIVNGERAVEAARLSLVHSISEAVDMANETVGDIPPSFMAKSFFGPLPYLEGSVLPLPSPMQLKN